MKSPRPSPDTPHLVCVARADARRLRFEATQAKDAVRRAELRAKAERRDAYAERLLIIQRRKLRP